MPVGDLVGWHQVLAEDFSVSAPLGSFLRTYSNMGAYPYPWTDTSRKWRSNPGYYEPAKTLSVANGVLDSWLHYDASLGKYLVSAITPRLPTMTYGRFTFRLRADRIPGYKIAPLLWPDSDVWPRDGEIDFPEGDLNGKPLSAFMHHAHSAGGQDSFPTGVDPTAWHTYDIAWTPGRVTFRVDGRTIGVSTAKVPSSPMHLVLQFETNMGPDAPPTSAQGHVQVDWITVYRMRSSAAPQARVTLREVSKASKLKVNVNPNKGKGYWRFQLQKKKADGTWQHLGTYRTRGAKETRAINQKQGTYRVVVLSKYGYRGVTSHQARLRK